MKLFHIPKRFVGMLLLLACQQALAGVFDPSIKNHQLSYGLLTKSMHKHLPKMDKTETEDVTFLSVGQRLDDEKATVLAENLHKFPKLKILQLQDNRIGNEGFKAIAQHLQSVPQLQEIRIWNNQIGDAGLQALAEKLDSVPNLNLLSLGHNRLGDAGLQALAPKIGSLKILWLGGDEITEKGIQILAYHAATFLNLQRLILDGRKISDKSVPALLTLMQTAPVLEWVNLSGTKLNDQGAEALLAGLKGKDEKTGEGKLNFKTKQKFQLTLPSQLSKSIQDKFLELQRDYPRKLSVKFELSST